MLLNMVLQLLKSKFAVNGMVFALLAVAIYFVGRRYLGLTTTMCILIIIVVLLIMVVWQLFKKMRENKEAAKLESSIKAQGDQAVFGMEGDKRVETEELQRKLVSAIDTLKKSKMAKGQKGTAVLYTLPWYMFIGPPAAGKTTMILNSGLEFPLETGKIRGVGGTRDCDWFFSESAIILDTAGRYTTEDDDAQEWFGFLDLLKKHRKEKPINGILVGISITDLMGKSPETIEDHASKIRKRLDELINRLGVHFPVYLIFTKCDLVQGCVEFFEDMNRKAREQVWGYTLSASEQSSNQLEGIFNREFKKLSGIIERLQLMRLSTPMKREDRRKVYQFPAEFEALRKPCTFFVSKLFQHNPFHEDPIFRGFYFTSGTQEGTPIDQVIRSLAKQYSLPKDHVESFSTDAETKSYFINDVFKDVVIPDQKMVTTTAKENKMRGTARLATAIVAGVVLLLFMGATIWGYFSSRATLNELADAMQQAKTVQWSAGQVIPNIEKLEVLREKIDEAENESMFLTLGMSRGTSAANAGKKLFYTKLRPLVEQQLYGEIETRLQHFTDFGTDEFGNIEDMLGAYILLGDDKLFANNMPAPSQEEAISHLQRSLVYLADLQFARPQNGMPEFSNDIKESIRRQVRLFGKIQRETQVPRFPSKAALVSSARTTYVNNLSDRSLYNSAIRQINSDNIELGSYSLQDLLGAGAIQGYLVSSGEVPAIYTRFVRDSLVVPQLIEKSKNPVVGNWIIGKVDRLPEALTNKDELLKAYIRYYKQDYENVWLTMLRSVYYDDSGGNAMVPQRLTYVSSNASSPFLALIDTVAINNRWQFDAAQSKEEAGIIQGALSSIGSFFGSSDATEVVDVQVGQKTMDAVRQLSSIPMEKDKPAQFLLQQILSYYVTIQTELATSPNGSAPSVNTALQAIGQTLIGFDPATQMALSNLFTGPLREVSVNVVESTTEAVGEEFQEDVVDAFKDIKGMYPFSSNSSQDVSTDEFASYFGPGGTLDQFLQKNIQELGNDINTVGYAQALESFKKQVEEIQTHFFGGGGLNTTFRLMADLPNPNGIVTQMSIKLDRTQYDIKALGFELEQVRTISWPGDGGEAFFEVRNDKPAKDRTSVQAGTWSFFRLLERGGLNASAGTQYQVRWVMNLDGQTVTCPFTIQADRAKNPITGLRLLRNFNLPTNLFK